MSQELVRFRRLKKRIKKKKKTTTTKLFGRGSIL